MAKISQEIDIALDGPISKVIERLEALRGQYPKSSIHIRSSMSHGEPEVAAYLSFERNETPLEIECRMWRKKAETLRELQKEAQAFDKNNVPYPNAAEITLLRMELGFFAMAPMLGTIVIQGGEIVVWDMLRGSRLRDGTWRSKSLSWFGSRAHTDEIEKYYEAQDAQYRPEGIEPV